MNDDNAPPWMPKAAEALLLARQHYRENEPGTISPLLLQAGKLVREIDEEFGIDTIPLVILLWTDCVIAMDKLVRGPLKPDQPTRLGFINLDTQEITGADEVPPYIAWAGRVIVARATKDDDMVDALFNSVTSPEQCADYTGGALIVCAMNLNKSAQKLQRRKN